MLITSAPESIIWEWQENNFLDSLNEKLARIEKERQEKVDKAHALYRGREKPV